MKHLSPIKTGIALAAVGAAWHLGRIVLVELGRAEPHVLGSLTFPQTAPRYFSWSSQRVGKPVPGLVSTLFHHMYSVPLRSVQMLLHAIEHVWHPMHLSRWNTIET